MRTGFAWAATVITLPVDVWLAMLAYVAVDAAVHGVGRARPNYLRLLTRAAVRRRNRAVRG
jgi:hypothetical protein